MNSQNRMNAGAEYVLYRIWATLQERDGIHAESLVACVGALAGFACQAYARGVGARGVGHGRPGARARVGAGSQPGVGAGAWVGVDAWPDAGAGARAGADAGAWAGARARPGAGTSKFGLTFVAAAVTIGAGPAGRNGAAYLAGDALNLPLIASPLSVWSLVRRSVQKLGAPLPDIEALSAHVTRTLGTSDFGVPRFDGGRRPRALPITYLTQLWPQVLPIAQRFCRRPAQLPVLFGIALQRAIEHTTEQLNPTLAASIAMECAIAMSKATLPQSFSDLVPASPARTDITLTAAPNGTSTAAANVVSIAPANVASARVPSKSSVAAANPSAARTIAAAARAARFSSKVATAASSPARARPSEARAARRRRAARTDAAALEASTFRMRMPSAKVVATLMSLAIVAVTSAAWKSEREEETPAIARVATGLKAPAFRPVGTASTFEPPRSLEPPSSFKPPSSLEQPVEQAQPESDGLPPDEPPVVLKPSTDDTDLPTPPPDQGEGIIAEEWQSA